MNDSLYDLRPFLSTHPGGAQWLELTAGTDVTEAFYVAHLEPRKIEPVLKRFLVGPCPEEIRRRSWFTFREDGFYMRFKDRAAKVSLTLLLLLLLLLFLLLLLRLLTSFLLLLLVRILLALVSCWLLTLMTFLYLLCYAAFG